MLNQYTEHQPTTSNIIILLYSLGLKAFSKYLLNALSPISV
ncbi:TPA: hypothetical protein ACN4SP_002242 [Staphylococcus aureus]|nr:hypothetical protein [Staphylococcus aureus]WIZ35575.1 hypothetical protein PCM48_10580 [Staphylococcus aureus]WJB25155.1 hypothetical protein PCL65_10720 [Staphylococcus aureus]GBZ04213.1 hypothetical protein M6K109_2228 [Staphylococcus aureus]SGV75416.1 Uncharacterised protein [Staphylococcus aureus]